MKTLILALLLPICANAAAPRMDWRRSGNTIVLTWGVQKSWSYELRYGNAPKLVNVFLYRFESCEAGRHSVSIPIAGLGNRFIQLIATPDLRRCP